MVSIDRRILVTGAAGFVGRHVIEALATLDTEAMLGVGRRMAAPLPNGTRFLSVDLNDRESLAACIKNFQPTHVLHLAAQASVGQATNRAAETWRINVSGLINLADVVLRELKSATFIYISSSEVYGRAFLSGEPLTETTIPEPMNVYARTKYVGEKLLEDIFGRTDIKLITLRPFNHIGKGQDERFVVSAFAHQIARIETDAMPPKLFVGNLSSYREFLDVRDVARAYVRVVEISDNLEPDIILNVAGGMRRTIADVIEDLRLLAKVPFEIIVDPSRVRPLEIPVALGNADRINSLTGWKPQFSWPETLSEIIDDARIRISETTLIR